MQLTDMEKKIIDSAVEAFLRYGARKTSMADIAEGAGVSRQTVYDQFGSKNDIIVTSIRYLTAQNLAGIRERLQSCATLAEQLGAYSEDIVSSYQMLQASSDAQDLIGGHNESGKAEMRNTYAKHEALIAEILSPHAEQISRSSLSVEQYAHFYVTSAMAFKYSAQDEEDLDNLIESLVSTTLSMAT